MEKTNLYEIVTNKFIEALKGGRIPWQKPWTGSSSAARRFGSNTAYSILNQMLIECQACTRYEGEDAETKIEQICTGRFLTFQAVQDSGAKINKGAKSYMVTFFKFFQPKDKDGNLMTTKNSKGEDVPYLIPMLRYYNVFSEHDCTGVPEEKQAVHILNPIEEADKTISEYEEREKIKIQFKASDKACYCPSKDYIILPKMEQFRIVEEFYSTAFHEITHSTGHARRLNRLSDSGVAAFGGEDYSREELVAEMGSAMCLNRLGIDCAKAFRNSVAYVQGWLTRLQNDDKAIFWASSRAEAAVKYIFGDV